MPSLFRPMCSFEMHSWLLVCIRICSIIAAWCHPASRVACAAVLHARRRDMSQHASAACIWRASAPNSIYPSLAAPQPARMGGAAAWAALLLLLGLAAPLAATRSPPSSLVPNNDAAIAASACERLFREADKLTSSLAALRQCLLYLNRTSRCSDECFLLTEQLDDTCGATMAGGHDGQAKLDALRAACGLPDPEPERRFPPACKAQFGMGGKLTYLAALDAARSLCPLGYEGRSCPPACKAALQQLSPECYSASLSADEQPDEVIARSQEPQFVACGFSVPSSKPSPAVHVELFLDPEQPRVRESLLIRHPWDPAAAAAAPQPLLPPACNATLAAFGMDNTAEALRAMGLQFEQACPDEVSLARSVPEGVAATDCKQPCKWWLGKVGSACFSAVYVRGPGDEAFVSALLAACQLPAAFPAAAADPAAPAPAPARAPTPDPAQEPVQEAATALGSQAMVTNVMLPLAAVALVVTAAAAARRRGRAALQRSDSASRRLLP
ncbi:hypothetical protein ABPG75_010453 [Micractinium tetrahymenae]